MTKFITRQNVGAAIAILCGVAAYWLALAPVHTVKTDLAYYGGGKLEQDNGVSYIWTSPQARFDYRDLPRFAPIYLTLRLELERPPEAPPAKLELVEVRGKNFSENITLQTLEFTPDKTGYRDYIVKIPAIQTASDDSLFLQLKSNGFRVAGDSRELGVRISSATLAVSKSGLLLTIFSRPLFPAFLLLLIGLVWWSRLLNFSALETTLVIIPIGFMTGMLTNYLVYAGWWQLADAVILLGTAYTWQRWGQNFLQMGAGWRAFGLLLAGLAALLGFFILAPGFAGDVFYWREVLAPIMQYGPVGVYPNAPRLVYPPGSVYQLWFYGLLTQPFGIAYNQSALKLLMGSALLLLFVSLWLSGLKSNIERTHLARTTLLSGFCISVLFVPAVWVQADGWLMWMMVAALLLVAWARPYSSAVVQAVGVLYKGQSWLLLPLYGLTFQWKFGWKTAFLAGGLCLGLIFGLGGLGFAFDYNNFNVFWKQPPVSGENDWGGINTFNLLHLLGYDKIRVPQPWLALSYGSVVVVYLVTLGLTWWRNLQISRALGNAKKSPEEIAETSHSWLIASAFLMTFIFFFWVKMHERYLYFGLVFLLFAALYQRRYYLIALILNLLFTVNLLFAYIPLRRDPIPNNFFFWRHLLKAELTQNILSLAGLVACGWLAWIYLRQAISPVAKLTPTEEPTPMAAVAE